MQVYDCIQAEDGIRVSFFFSSRRRHTRLVRDWSSDVCSSDLGVGNQNFMDLMMQLATGLFIQQCRFNPQHNAESEQQLYNELPNWLKQDDGNQNSLLLDLKTSTAVYTAKMPRESLINHLSGYYQKIHRQLATLATEKNTDLLVSSAMAALPGLLTPSVISATYIF